MTTDPTSGHQDARTNAQQGTGSAGQKNPYFDFTGYQLRMPKTWPTSVREVLPPLRRDELSRITRTDHMPMDARIGYWIWLVGCVLTIMAGPFEAVTASPRLRVTGAGVMFSHACGAGGWPRIVLDPRLGGAAGTLSIQWQSTEPHERTPGGPPP